MADIEVNYARAKRDRTFVSGLCSKGWLCVPIHIPALVHPSPFHLNKFIENSLKFLKHLNLLYKHSST